MQFDIVALSQKAWNRSDIIAGRHRARGNQLAQYYSRLMSRHVPANFGKVRLAAAGLVDELAVEHDDETI
jgi:hypothetical protein